MFYINNKKVIHYLDLCIKFNVSELEAKEITHLLNVNGYIFSNDNIEYLPTHKGKHFLSSFIANWLFNNLLAIIAIIISIIALFK